MLKLQSSSSMTQNNGRLERNPKAHSHTPRKQLSHSNLKKLTKEEDFVPRRAKDYSTQEHRTQVTFQQQEK
jgi:hypothetical protein